MKHLLLAFLCLLLSPALMAQTEAPAFRLSLQTDLVAYTAPGGWSIWATAQHNKNKLSLALVNYPNRYRSTYEATGIWERDRFTRLQYARHAKPLGATSTFVYGVNIELHFRELTEDGNPSEVLNDKFWKMGPFVGWEWLPWGAKANALKNIAIYPWLGANYIPNSTAYTRVFEQTGSVYPIYRPFEAAIGLNVSYTLFEN